MIKKIDEILANIRSIGFYLASEIDVQKNKDFREKKLSGSRNHYFRSDIIDLKMSDLEFNLNTLQDYFNTLDIGTLSNAPKIEKIRISFAYSSTYKEDVDKIRINLSDKNDTLIEQNHYLECKVWEKESLAFNNTRKQDDFNKAIVEDADIFICLIGKDVGMFTMEEFDKAYQLYSENKKPLRIYIYFQKFDGNGSSEDYENEGWVKRTQLKQYIEDKHKQVVGKFSNAEDLIGKINNNLDEDIKIILEKRKNQSVSID